MTNERVPETKALVDQATIFAQRIMTCADARVQPYAQTIAKCLTETCQDIPNGVSKGEEAYKVIAGAERAFFSIFANNEEAFGLEEFQNLVIPEAIKTYADDPRFMFDALKRILAIASQKKPDEIKDFFRNSAHAINLYGYDIHELTDEGIHHSSHHTTDKPNRDVKELITREKASKELERIIEEAKEDYGIQSTEEMPPLFRYQRERDFEDERISLVLPEVFKSKLKVEAGEEKAAMIMELLNQTTEALSEIKEIGESLGSQNVVNWAELTWPATVESILKKYVLTPSKYYSELARRNLQTTLNQILEDCQNRKALFEETELLIASENPLVQGRGILLSGQFECDSSAYDYFPDLNLLMHFGKPGKFIAEISGNSMVLMDTKGRRLLKRVAVSSIGTPVENTALINGKNLNGVFNVKTDDDGKIVLFEQGYDQNRRAVFDGRSLISLVPNKEYKISVENGDATVYLGRQKVGSFSAEYFKNEEYTKIQKSLISPELEDKVQLIYPGCNIWIGTDGRICRDISLQSQARRIGRALHFIKKVYPEASRIEEILTETTIIMLNIRNGLRGSSTAGNRIFVNVGEENPKKIAAILIHEEAHLAAGKLIGNRLDNLVAEEFRGGDKLLGTKIKVDLVNEAMQELISRMAALNFIRDALDRGLSTYGELSELIQDQGGGIRVDIDQMRDQNLLSREGVDLLNEIDASYKELMKSINESRNQEVNQAADWHSDLKEIFYKLIPKESDLSADIFFDDFVAQAVEPILMKYGLLDQPKHKQIDSPIIKALPGPLSEGKISYDEVEVELEDEDIEDEGDEESDDEEDTVNDIYSTHPDAYDNKVKYEEEIDEIIEREERELDWYKRNVDYTDTEDDKD